MKLLKLLFLSSIILSCDSSSLQWDLDKIERLALVKTMNVTNIINTEAIVVSEVMNDGGTMVTQRGVCWSMNQNPTIADATTNNGTGSGTFTSTLTNLSPNTTYYVKAYATNGLGTAYGDQISFTTTNISGTLPTLNTTNVSGISINSAMSGGNISSDGGSMVTQRGVCWSTNPNPTISDAITNNGTGLGTFTSTLTNLSPNTTYYVKAYATNGLGTAYGDQISFTTTTNVSGTLPTLNTTNVSGISINGAMSGGNISSDGGSMVTQRGVCWSTNPNPTISDASTSDGIGLGTFSSTISNLNPNTVYYVRAYATNDLGTAYGNEILFTTQQPSASLVAYNNCSSLDGITSLYYGMNGTSASWGISSAGHNGNCLVAPDPNQIGQLGQVVGSNHYLQFNRNFNSNGYIEFWVNTYNAGQNNLIPSIAVNGVLLGNATMIEGQQSSFYWMKVRTPIIQAGMNTIRVLLSGSYYVLKIDEMEFYEY